MRCGVRSSAASRFLSRFWERSTRNCVGEGTDVWSISDDDLIRYVVGEATPVTERAIRAEAATNTELAAMLELLGHCGGEVVPSASTIPVPRKHAIGGRRLILAIAAAFAVAGISWAGWKLLVAPPLLADDFNKGWGDKTIWQTPRQGVFFENDHARLMKNVTARTGIVRIACAAIFSIWSAGGSHRLTSTPPPGAGRGILAMAVDESSVSSPFSLLPPAGVRILAVFGTLHLSDSA